LPRKGLTGIRKRDLILLGESWVRDEFGGGNILNDLSLVEFTLVRKLKAVCIFVTRVSTVADRMGNGKAMQHLSFPIFL